LAAAALTLVGIPAWAHVEVETNRAFAGATDVTLTFHVPNELAPATTQGITFFFPTDHPLLGVTTDKQNGFTPKVTTTQLAKPVQGPNGPVTEVVGAVEFAGGRLSGKEEKAFTFHVDQLPSDTRTLTFKVLQKYSTGETVSWIEIAADGAAEPEHPAPVLTLGPPRTASQPATASPSASVTLGASAPPTTAPTTAPATDPAETGTGAKVPLAAAAIGLVLAAGGWALWRRRRVPGDAP
jgi:LPXTG-motif cell wall-anchored protein